jgi:hypothetical protein
MAEVAILPISGPFAVHGSGGQFLDAMFRQKVGARSGLIIRVTGRSGKV